jgi:ribosome recycling factor
VSPPDSFDNRLKEATEHVIDETLFEAEEKMDRAIEFAKEEFAVIRTGRATPAMFSKIIIDYYGTPTQLPQMASIAVPEPRMAIIKPYDNSQMHAMEKAIRDSDLAVDRGAAARDGQDGQGQG